MLETNNLNLTLGGRPVLCAVNFACPSGHKIAVIGPNGSGKTTLLRALSGEITGVRNEVYLHNKPLSYYSTKMLSQLRCVLSQQVHLDFPFFVSEVVEMAYQCRVSDSVIKENLSLFQVEHLIDKNYQLLSGGEQRRVQLSRVLAQLLQGKENLDNHDSQYILLDECTANLDPKYQQQALKTIIQLSHKIGFGVVMVLHDLTLAAQHADHIYLMKEGKIFCQGTVAEVMRADILSEAYDCPMEVIPHSLSYPIILST